MRDGLGSSTLRRQLMLKYIYNLSLAVDQAINTILFGHPDETLSSRLGRTIKKERYLFVRPFRKVIDRIFFFDSRPGYSADGGNIIHHCENSIMKLEQINIKRNADYEIWSWSLENGNS
jgi:hypothetical protein